MMILRTRGYYSRKYLQGKLIKLNEFERMWEKMQEDVDGRRLAALARELPNFGKNIISSNDRSALSGARLALQGFPKELLRDVAFRLGFLNSQQDEENNIKENPSWTVLNYEDECYADVTNTFLEKVVQNKAAQVILWVESISGDSVDDVCMVWKESFGGYNPNTVFDREKQLAHLQLMIDLKTAAQKGFLEEESKILQRFTISPSELKGALLAASKGKSRGHTQVTDSPSLWSKGRSRECGNDISPSHSSWREFRDFGSSSQTL